MKRAPRYSVFAGVCVIAPCVARLRALARCKKQMGATPCACREYTSGGFEGNLATSAGEVSTKDTQMMLRRRGRVDFCESGTMCEPDYTNMGDPNRVRGRIKTGVLDVDGDGSVGASECQDAMCMGNLEGNKGGKPGLTKESFKDLQEQYQMQLLLEDELEQAQEHERQRRVAAGEVVVEHDHGFQWQSGSFASSYRRGSVQYTDGMPDRQFPNMLPVAAQHGSKESFDPICTGTFIKGQDDSGSPRLVPSTRPLVKRSPGGSPRLSFRPSGTESAPLWGGTASGAPPDLIRQHPSSFAGPEAASGGNVAFSQGLRSHTVDHGRLAQSGASAERVQIPGPQIMES